MEKVDQKQQNDTPPPINNTQIAILHFREGLASGKHWYIALLEAIGLWTDESEYFSGRDYQYLIEGEAFDWLLLAERLCDLVDDLIPEQEKHALLFQSKPPLPLTGEEFKNLIGHCKYRQYLNYFYGITVEEALVQAVREEVRKERRANCWTRNDGEEDEIYIRIYGETQSTLFKQFRKEKHYQYNAKSNLSEIKEFIYWCFKYRVRTCEKAKVASDTNKALGWLRKNGHNC
jgi:hypothetical protein